MNKRSETGYATLGWNLQDCEFYANGNVVDIRKIRCSKMYIYGRGGDRKTALVHYNDAVEFWEYNPGLWKGWKLAHTIRAE